MKRESITCIGLVALYLICVSLFYTLAFFFFFALQSHLFILISLNVHWSHILILSFNNLNFIISSIMNFQRLKLRVQKVLNRYLWIFIIFKAKGKFIFGMHDVQTCFIKPKKKKNAKDMGLKHNSHSKRVRDMKLGTCYMKAVLCKTHQSSHVINKWQLLHL